MKGHHGRNQEAGIDQRPWRDGILTSVCSVSCSFAFLHNPGSLAQGDTAHSDLGPSVLIINQEHAIQRCQVTTIMEGFFPN